MARFSTFGQELYLEESIRAIESFPEVSEHDGLAVKIAGLLPHPSESTRLRIAGKIIQRFFKDYDGKSHAVPFLKLVNGLKRESERRDLLYWRAALTDDIITAIARDIFYPYFVLNVFPTGYNEAAFRMANTATLFADDRVISRDFVVEYARRMWKFDSARTVTLSLRIMKQAGIVDAVSVKIGRRHVLGYFPQPHSLQPEVFAYCMWEEFSGGSSPRMPSLDKVQNGNCVRLFLLTRLQMESLLRTIEKRKLIEYATLPGGRHVCFKTPDLNALVGALIED